MSNAAVDTDILIVGGGPVGLFLANECARRSLRWRLIETHSKQSEHSKALAIFPRTLDAFPDIYPALTAEIILNERFALKSPACCLLHSASQ